WQRPATAAAVAQRRHAPVRPAAAGEAACDDEGHGPRLIFQPCRLRLMPALQAGQPAGLMRLTAAGLAAVGGLMRGSAPAPQCKEKVLLTILSGPRPSFILVYQTQLSIRGQGASMPLPARLESSKRCYWLCQTSGWNEWAGENH